MDTTTSNDKAKISSQHMQGLFTSSPRGFGFVTVEGQEQDLFIPPDKTMNAFYHDTVEVRLLPSFGSGFDRRGPEKGKGEQRQEAEVVKILEHGVTTLVGTFQRIGKQSTVEPDNHKIGSEININQMDTMGAVTGHKVVVQMTNYGSANRGPEGKVIEILGHMDDPGVDILSIIRTYNLPGEFPEDVVNEVRSIPDHIEVTDQDLKEREDWREHTIVTIDGPDTKDIDDAVCVEKTEKGWTLGVFIADVANYVHEGSPLDKEAFRRATSNYLVDRVIPMLPHELSNGICSLNQGEDRYSLSCIMDLNERGEVVSSRVVETIIRSAAKLSYPGVMALFTDNDNTEMLHAQEMQGYIGEEATNRAKKITDMLFEARRLANVLARRREERGSIDFDFTESEIILDENGVPIDIRPHESNEATVLIENFMIMANERVAKTFCEKKVPFVYRTHAKPLPEKIDALREFIHQYGYKLPDREITPKDLSGLLEQVKGTPEEQLVTTMTLRSMQRAMYTPECGGHYGLALKYYCHFTSPIRRYPDTQIHRIIKEVLHGQMTEERIVHYNSILPNVCLQSSNMERRADEAERDTDKQKKAEYMNVRIGQTFDGLVSGVTGWGLYVALPNTVEGLIPIADLGNEYFVYDEKALCLRGDRTGQTYTLGQKVRVTVSSVDVIQRKIDFVLEGHQAGAKRPQQKTNGHSYSRGGYGNYSTGMNRPKNRGGQGHGPGRNGGSSGNRKYGK